MPATRTMVLAVLGAFGGWPTRRGGGSRRPADERPRPARNSPLTRPTRTRRRWPGTVPGRWPGTVPSHVRRGHVGRHESVPIRPHAGGRRPWRLLSNRAPCPALPPPRRPVSRNGPRCRRHPALPRRRRLPDVLAVPARRRGRIRLGRAGALPHGHALPTRARHPANGPLGRDEAPQRALRPLLQRPVLTTRPPLR